MNFLLCSFVDVGLFDEVELSVGELSSILDELID